MVDPKFDPHYLEHDIGTNGFLCHWYFIYITTDLQGLVDMVKCVRKLCDTAPYKDILGAFSWQESLSLLFSGIPSSCRGRSWT